MFVEKSANAGSFFIATGARNRAKNKKYCFTDGITILISFAAVYQNSCPGSFSFSFFGNVASNVSKAFGFFSQIK